MGVPRKISRKIFIINFLTEDLLYASIFAFHCPANYWDYVSYKNPLGQRTKNNERKLYANIYIEKYFLFSVDNAKMFFSLLFPLSRVSSMRIFPLQQLSFSLFCSQCSSSSEKMIMLYKIYHFSLQSFQSQTGSQTKRTKSSNNRIRCEIKKCLED